MKRRDFLAASAVLSLLASPAAQAVKNPPPAKKPAAKPTPKPGAKPAGKAGAKSAVRHAATPEGGAPSAIPEPHNVISLPEEPPARWRTVDLQTQIGLRNLKGAAKLWLPLAQYKDTPWQRSLGHTWEGNFSSAGIYRDPVAEMEVFVAEWAENTDSPRLQFSSQIATQDRHFDVTRRGAIAERTEVLRRCLQPTSQIPIDGIVRRTAERAIGRIRDPLAMGKALYDWVVERTEFDSNGSGLGSANIAQMLESGNLSGRSADIAQLFVALCRSVGIPARPVFGLRNGTSRLFGSLGILGELNAAQHCRAELYIPGYSWIGVDPADVRKAIREENLSSFDPKLTVLKKLLFGFWEMNWIGFNAAQDVTLRGGAAATLPNLIYPVVESGEDRFNSLDTGRMTYSVTATRIDTP